ncbi:alpha/beta hydrolase fold domain-containing protein [Coraliomargarita sp. SDUM461004]|uniref:Alpha/beta hydrolase fold domain-containing protein n=1 Tax=Thalassobacterium sedimentorum TaxID=3041258 RepID=A0ABU1AE35_9BACT|nr:alpha/beta hydrolase fold domain-containing protein [Coraliomargarita sp. SDUM461004]MDQ8192928.1 alpha/beta hydrolase fold domain-containing protein [Coraliomargarita sp. SDUM461004]
MRWIRANAHRLNINPDKIGVIGFSAGGHLACCVSNGFNRAEWQLDPDNSLSEVSARPDASILAYPVISTGTQYAHHSSMEKLLGQRFETKVMDSLRWEDHVHPNYPSTFLWHTN